MNKWIIENGTYYYDGSIEGLFTICYLCLNEKKIPLNIVNGYDYQMDLLNESKYIETNYDYSEIIFKQVSNISDFTLFIIYTVFLAGEIDKEIIILKYIINAFKYGNKINSMRNKECMINVYKLRQRVMLEAHRFKGFLTFTELSNKLLYAKIEPDNNIIEFLGSHFKERLKNEAWMIHDLKRNLVAIYDGKNLVYGSDENLNLDKIKEYSKDDKYEEYWKSYFKQIGIKERENKRCQLNFMPKRYWKNMIEVESEEKYAK